MVEKKYLFGSEEYDRIGVSPSKKRGDFTDS
jgi:hypothetical protein